MGYVNLKEMMAAAKEGQYAVGAFNIVDYNTTIAAIKAAEAKNAPIILQTSVKTVNQYGCDAIVRWIKPLAERSFIPIVLHLDHCKDIAKIRECIESGWTSVMIDASAHPFDINVEMTREVVQIAMQKNVSVEGELGTIVGVEDDLFINIDEGSLADPSTSAEYVYKTGVDILAPAIGTAHGLYKSKPNVNLDLLQKIAQRTDIPIAMHGGTGISGEVFRQCIKRGVTKINISTNIKQVYRQTHETYYKENPGDIEAIKVIKLLEEKTIELISSLIDIFGSNNKTR